MLSRVLAALLLATAARAATSPLVSSSSDFVRAQASSGVHWQPWSEANLARAKQQQKPVYVFIGSPLSELTRATITQTFGSEKTVTWVNESFFCIFVDADAQPEVAALGQHFITSVKQLRGSPVHLWLTPDTLQPYDGANYLPPSEEWGKPGFLKAARAALETWTVDPARARALAAEALEMMKLPPVDTTAPLDIEAKLAAAAKAWVAAADPVNGGFGSAPKLPEPELIRFLLGRGEPGRGAWTEKAVALKAAVALVSGALRDPVDGGFYRRCIDEAWREPYHQKTLVDQARIALALLEAWRVTGIFRLSSAVIPPELIVDQEKLYDGAVGALGFALKELRNPDGSYAVALDGTGEENADPTKRPKFTKVGTASPGTLALLAVALQRANYPQFNEEAARLTRLLKESLRPQLGVALFLRETQDPAAGTLLGEINEIYFDPAAGAYMATPAQLPAGIAIRVPASGETPSAEVLALLAGVDAKTADLIRRNLMHQIEYDELPPGDVLLGLSR